MCIQVKEKLYPAEDEEEEEEEEEDSEGESGEQAASTVDVIQALLDESRSLVPHPAVEKTRSEMQVDGRMPIASFEWSFKYTHLSL